MENELLRSSRPINEAWIGGVCAGLANHLKWSALLLRVLFVAAASYKLSGVVVYLALWLVMPRRRVESAAPGLEAASRSGMRPDDQPKQRLLDASTALALGLFGAGLLWLLERSGLGLGPALVPAGLASLGLAGIWWETDHIPSVGKTTNGWSVWLKVLLRNWMKILVVVLSLLFISAAIGWIAIDNADLDNVSWLLLIVGLAVLGLILAILPLILRIRRELAAARDDKLIADARADMAAHLHDSVLQTLALIQRQADDHTLVQTLARRQERELRAYLYGEESDETSFSQALAQTTQQVEERFGVEIDLVSVGELNACPPDKQDALTGAAREALMNAA
ncbi:MAG: PspC domain-containing protein, partial [Propionibacteriaceae bacterium]|nr:PspC domain-containing protein [Propionibacteriaceae bacterium]